MFIFLLTLGTLLCGFGCIAFIAVLPHGSRNISLKEAFSAIFSSNKARISFSCFIIGFLILQYCFWLITP